MQRRLPISATVDSDFGISGFQRGKRRLHISVSRDSYILLVGRFLKVYWIYSIFCIKKRLTKLVRQPLFLFYISLNLFVFIPAFDLNIINAYCAERIDKRSRKTSVCKQWNIIVNSRAANLISVIKLTRSKVFRDIDYHINLFILKHFQCLRLLLFTWPEYSCTWYVVFRSEERRVGKEC